MTFQGKPYQPFRKVIHYILIFVLLNEIVNPSNKNGEILLFDEHIYRFMYAALMEAEYAAEAGEVPVGAVVVYENQIIGRGYNQTIQLNDPTAHAEMIAITAAANHLGNQRLEDCDLFVTLEPCLMCSGAIIHARLRSLYFAAFDPKAGACGSLYNIPADQRLNHSLPVYSGVLEKESTEMLKQFFKSKRK